MRSILPEPPAVRMVRALGPDAPAHADEPAGSSWWTHRGGVAEVEFDADGVSLRLSKEEWWFLSSAAGYVLHGERLPEHDFRNILMMLPEDAEQLFEQLSEAEVAARIAGSHWAPRPDPRSAW